MGNKQSPILFFIFLCAALFLVYLPAVYFDYIFHDDIYFWLEDIGLKHHFLSSAEIAMGRPLAAFFLDVEQAIALTLGIKFIKLIAIFLLALCGLLMRPWLMDFLHAEGNAFLLALMVLTLPAFEVLVMCAAGGFIIISVLLGCLAFDAAGKAGGGWKAVVCLLAGVMIYPSGAMFYWTMAGLYVLLTWQRPLESMKKYMAVGLGACGIYMIFLAALGIVYGQKMGASSYSPFVLSLDAAHKLVWFLKEPLLNALNLWNIFPCWPVAVFTGGVLFAGACAAWIDRASPRRFRVVLLALLLGLAFLPNLAAQLDTAVYRCSGPLTALILMALVGLLRQGVRGLGPSLGGRILTVILSAAALLGSWLAFDHVLYHRVLPSHIEWRLFQSVPQMASLQESDGLYVAPPALLPRQRYDEFDIVTTQFYSDTLILLMDAYAAQHVRRGLPDVYILFPNTKVFQKVNGYIYRPRPNAMGAEYKQLGKTEPFRPLRHQLFLSQKNLGVGIVFVPVPAYADSLKKRILFLDLRDLFFKGARELPHLPN